MKMSLRFVQFLQTIYLSSIDDSYSDVSKGCYKCRQKLVFETLCIVEKKLVLLLDDILHSFVSISLVGSNFLLFHCVYQAFLITLQLNICKVFEMKVIVLYDRPFALIKLSFDVPTLSLNLFFKLSDFSSFTSTLHQMDWKHVENLLILCFKYG